MKITRGNPENLKNVRASVYNHYVRVDNPNSLIFISGQLPRNNDGEAVGIGCMLEQTRQCIRNIEQVLHSAGAELGNVVSTKVYTTDIREFQKIIKARQEFFICDLPTSTMVEVSHLTEPELMVEIEVIAAL